MKLRTVIFWLHLITGLTIGSVIFIMALTGMMIAFEPQIVEFTEKNVRHIPVPAPGMSRLGAGEIIAAAAQRRPTSSPTGLAQESDPTASATVYFEKEGRLFVNPYTGQVLGGVSKTHDLMHKIIEFHRWLGSREIGKPIANACNLAFFVMILSGLFLWWPQQWNASVRQAILFFNPRLTGKARDWNWHNAIGLWCLPLLLVTTLTGSMIAYTWASNLLFRLSGSPFPAQQVMKGSPALAEKGIDFDTIWITASKQVPNWQSISVRLPKEPGGLVNVSIVEPGAKPFMRSQLTFQPTGEVVKWEPYQIQNTGRRMRAWIVPLHTGEAWGIFGQILMFTGAFGASLLVWTGFSLSWRRFFSKKNSGWSKGGNKNVSLI